MYLNALGRIVAEEWKRSADIRAEIEVDAYVIMPNHIQRYRIDHAVWWARR